MAFTKIEFVYVNEVNRLGCVGMYMVVGLPPMGIGWMTEWYFGGLPWFNNVKVCYCC